MRRFSDLTRRLAGLGSERWGVHQRAVQRTNAGDDVVMLSIGEPDTATPAAIVAAAHDSLLRGRTKYSNGQGEPEFLEAVARRYTRRMGRPFSTDQVIFMPGAHTALYAACLAILQEGDDILVPEPYYASYDSVLVSTGAQIATVPLLPEDGFHLQIEALESGLTDSTRAVLLNNPHNPTGAVLEPRRVAEIAQFCARNDLWLISDEVYEDLVYDGQFASPLGHVEHADRVVVVSSVSKSHAMTGWRCGWAVGPADLIARVRDVSESMMFGAQPFLQDATVVALDGDFEECEAMRKDYQRRAGLVVDAFVDLPELAASAPQGGIFMMIDLRATELSGQAAAALLLDEHAVATMPGEAFGPSGAGHVRLSLTASDTDIVEGCRRIRAFVEQRRNRASQPSVEPA